MTAVVLYPAFFTLVLLVREPLLEPVLVLFIRPDCLLAIYIYIIIFDKMITTKKLNVFFAVAVT